MDTGMGLSPENIDRVFEPWVQEEQAKGMNYGGCGLGLAVRGRRATWRAGKSVRAKAPCIGEQPGVENSYWSECCSFPGFSLADLQAPGRRYAR